jgi:hypothetical protein
MKYRAVTIRPGVVLDDRYRIDEGPLSRDGLGQAWRATDMTLHRPVTVTVLRNDFASDDAFVEWWHRESRKAHARPPSPDDSLHVCDFGRTQLTAADGRATTVYQVAERIELVPDGAEQQWRPSTGATGGSRRRSHTPWEDDLTRRVTEITDPNATLRQARELIQQARDAADAGAGEREALMLMTMAAEAYEALDTFIRLHNRLPTDWTSQAQ